MKKVGRQIIVPYIICTPAFLGGRAARKKTGSRKGSQNKSLPGQVSKQLRKHYVNKYGVVKKK